jgi:ribosomal protein S18 acetylase RimI-like enzyme
MISINKLKKGDIRSFRLVFSEIFKNGFEDYPHRARQFVLTYWNPKRLAEKIIDGNYLFLIAKEGQRPIGFLIGKFYPNYLATILWLGIISPKRGLGLGRELVRKWEKWASGKKARILKFSTANFANENFYTKLGYRELPKIVRNDWGMEKIKFVKNLF